jgi:hypothetical protein
MNTLYWSWQSPNDGYRSDGGTYVGLFCPRCDKAFNWFDDDDERINNLFRCRGCLLTGIVDSTSVISRGDIQEKYPTYDLSMIREPYDVKENNVLQFYSVDVTPLVDVKTTDVNGHGRVDIRKLCTELETYISTHSNDYHTYIQIMLYQKPELFIALFGIEKHDDILEKDREDRDVEEWFEERRKIKNEKL